MFVNNVLFLQASAGQPVGPGGTAKYVLMHMAKNVVHGGVTRHNTPLPPYTVLGPYLPLWTFFCYGTQKVRVVLAVLFPCVQPE